MSLEILIQIAQQQGASDLHLEPGLAAALRVRGTLKLVGEPLTSAGLVTYARSLLGEAAWNDFLDRRSADLSRTIAGVRCRVNILHTSRGVGFAIRLLASFQVTLDRLNLHPDFRRLTQHSHGLVLICGPTGSGKSSTLSALIQEINLTQSSHVVTIENPIEYFFRPRKSFIRQREVGRDTPSFEQALIDSLREDPDVLMVGEMREPSVMQLTLNASETGHLVYSTVHSSNCIEALQRVIGAFPSEIQNNVAAQMADVLVAVVSQRLVFRPELNMRLPECEVLMATNPVRHFIRSRDFFKIPTVIETGAEHGMWSFARYRAWMDSKKDWVRVQTSATAEPPDSEGSELSGADSATGSSLKPIAVKRSSGSDFLASPSPAISTRSALKTHPGGPIEIEPVEGGLSELLKKLEHE